MNPVLRTAIFSALLLNAGTALSATTFISGTVRDSEGAVIARANITIRRDLSFPGENDNVVVTSDNNGQFKAEVVPGFYDIFVSAPAFSPQCTKVRVRDTQPAIYLPRLRADPLVIQERADTFWDCCHPI